MAYHTYRSSKALPSPSPSIHPSSFVFYCTSDAATSFIALLLTFRQSPATKSVCARNILQGWHQSSPKSKATHFFFLSPRKRRVTAMKHKTARTLYGTLTVMLLARPYRTFPELRESGSRVCDMRVEWLNSECKCDYAKIVEKS